MSDLPRPIGAKSARTAGPRTSAPAPARARSRLFAKYVGLFAAVVSVALLANGIFDVWFSYQEHKTRSVRIQREQAEAAAAKIGQFIREIESQLGWTTQLPWSAGTIEQRRFDALAAAAPGAGHHRAVAARATGKERLRVSRLAMDVVGSDTDYSKDPKFTEAVAHKVYYGPVYFRRESEPYMTLAIAGTRRDAGVSVAEVNLKLIWDVVSQIKVGERGQAYVVDAQGRLIAHPDISLVLRNTDMSSLAQVQAARAGAAGETAEDGAGGEEHSGPRGADRLMRRCRRSAGWCSSNCRARRPTRRFTPRCSGLAFMLLAALLFAVLAGMFLARTMVGADPGAAGRRGAHRQRRPLPAHLDQDRRELEALADQFNDMAGRLEKSYADLEKKVEERTVRAGPAVAELQGARRSEPGGELDAQRRNGAHHDRRQGSQARGHGRRRHLGVGPAPGEFHLRATYGRAAS